jgi:hypothetical protein
VSAPQACTTCGHRPTRRRKARPTGVIADAFQTWRRIRLDFDDHIEAQLTRAEHDTRGILLNPAGRAKGIDPRTLFYGPRARVNAYASEELLDWFHEHGRTTFATYERHHPEARP